MRTGWLQQTRYCLYCRWYRSSLVAQMIKNLPAKQETQVQSLGWEDSLEKGMETHYSILVWQIPWTEEPDGLQSMALERVRHDWVTDTFTLLRWYSNYPKRQSGISQAIKKSKRTKQRQTSTAPWSASGCGDHWRRSELGCAWRRLGRGSFYSLCYCSVIQSCPTLLKISWTAAHQDPLSSTVS